MGVKLKLTGGAELKAAFKELVENTSGRTGKAVLKRALVQAAGPVADRMSELAPHGSGKLSRSIVIAANGKQRLGKGAYASAKRSGASNEEAVRALRDAQRDGPAVVVLVGPAKKQSGVASQVEFGVRPHVIKPKKGEVLEIWRGGQIAGVAREVQHPGARPKPFMRPAFEQSAPTVLSEMQRAGLEQIAKAAARARTRSKRKP
ncbi:MAG: HK97 gp10 family phage protein [Caulobacterales bacterium]|nr:HK97 gp10 family phage protein [Caulobacterales bacterium]